MKGHHTVMCRTWHRLLRALRHKRECGNQCFKSGNKFINDN